MTGLNLLLTQQRRGADFDKVDNPGGWCIFSYCFVFMFGAQGGQYKSHCLPDGFYPLSLNEDNAEICTYEGWIFNQWWKKGEYEDWVR